MTESTNQTLPGTNDADGNPDAAAASVLPSVMRVGWWRSEFEIRQFFRRRDAVIFTFSMPIILLLLLGTMFKHDYPEYGITVADLYVTGLIAGGLLTTSFQNLGNGVTADRVDGTLKRLRATPMPRSSYFVGKTLLVLVVSVVETALMLIIGVAILGMHLPAIPARWVTLIWVLVLSVGAFSLLGIATAGLVRSWRNVTTVVSVPVILLQFISGVYVPLNELPRWLLSIASIFPLKWTAQGVRAALLPSRAAGLEPGHSYQLGMVALVLASWLIVGMVLCVTTFRWGRQPGER